VQGICGSRHLSHSQAGTGTMGPVVTCNQQQPVNFTDPCAHQQQAVGHGQPIPCMMCGQRCMPRAALPCRLLVPVTWNTYVAFLLAVWLLSVASVTAQAPGGEVLRNGLSDWDMLAPLMHWRKVTFTYLKHCCALQLISPTRSSRWWALPIVRLGVRMREPGQRVAWMQPRRPPPNRVCSL
jgi:hypothetical protein